MRIHSAPCASHWHYRTIVTISMIDLLLYHSHIVAAVYAFVQRWQHEGIKGGILAVTLIGLAFTIVWALMGPIARLLMPEAGSPGELFTSDTLSLILTVAVETPLFIIFFLKKTPAPELQSKA